MLRGKRQEENNGGRGVGVGLGAAAGPVHSDASRPPRLSRFALNIGANDGKTIGPDPLYHREHARLGGGVMGRGDVVLGELAINSHTHPPSPPLFHILWLSSSMFPSHTYIPTIPGLNRIFCS